MSINVSQSFSTTGAKAAIPLNRHGNPQYSISAVLGSTGTYTVEGTLDQLNREGITPVWQDITGLIALTASTFDKIENTPLEAVRINIAAVGTTLNFKIQQNS